MLGLGETREQILQTMDDLLAVGWGNDYRSVPATVRGESEVKEYVTPETFKEYERIGLEKELVTWRVARWFAPVTTPKSM